MSKCFQTTSYLSIPLYYIPLYIYLNIAVFWGNITL